MTNINFVISPTPMMKACSFEDTIILLKKNKEVKCETTPLPIMQINEDNMTKYEFQITFGRGSDQIKLKFRESANT
jgi:hypothetical protein